MRPTNRMQTTVFDFPEKLKPHVTSTLCPVNGYSSILSR